MSDTNSEELKNVDVSIDYRAHAEQLHVPIIEGFKVQSDDNPQTILLASGYGYVEQLASDGHVEDGEFEERIKKVIGETKEIMINNGATNVDHSFAYYNDYTNGVFNFKIYVCDMIVPEDNEQVIVRQLNAYFVEPKMKDFYQLSISAGPFTMPTKYLKPGVIDLQNDKITQTLDKFIKVLMDNLTYKN